MYASHSRETCVHMGMIFLIMCFEFFISKYPCCSVDCCCVCICVSEQTPYTLGCLHICLSAFVCDLPWCVHVVQTLVRMWVLQVWIPPEVALGCFAFPPFLSVCYTVVVSDTALWVLVCKFMAVTINHQHLPLPVALSLPFPLTFPLSYFPPLPSRHLSQYLPWYRQSSVVLSCSVNGSCT